MILINILYCLMLLEMLICIMWRFVCSFRKRGSCKFTKCPFRKDFFSTSYLGVHNCFCDKCLPTEEEIEEQERILEYLEDYLKKDIPK